MINLKRIFEAGRVRRWHSNPDMSWTHDYNDAHQGRVARIILALHPEPSQFLLAAALTHDDGELIAGDISRDTKNAHPEMREMVRQVERKGWSDVWLTDSRAGYICDHLTGEEKEWLQLADKLDGHAWMLHKKPSLASREDWRNERFRILALAQKLGVYDEVAEMFREWLQNVDEGNKGAVERNGSTVRQKLLHM